MKKITVHIKKGVTEGIEIAHCGSPITGNRYNTAQDVVNKCDTGMTPCLKCLEQLNKVLAQSNIIIVENKKGLFEITTIEQDKESKIFESPMDSDKYLQYPLAIKGDWTATSWIKRETNSTETPYKSSMLKRMIDLVPVDNKWHHVTITNLNGLEGNYIDGEPVKQAEVGSYNIHNIVLDTDDMKIMLKQKPKDDKD
jgi:hypothetical protein